MRSEAVSEPTWDIAKVDGAVHAAGPINLTVLDGGGCFLRRAVKLDLGRPTKTNLPAVLAALDASAEAAAYGGANPAGHEAWSTVMPTLTPETIREALADVAELLARDLEGRQKRITVLVGELDGVRVYLDGNGTAILTRQDLQL